VGHLGSGTRGSNFNMGSADMVLILFHINAYSNPINISSIVLCFFIFCHEIASLLENPAMATFLLLNSLLYVLQLLGIYRLLLLCV